MKVYIFADQEGTACVFSRREKYAFAKEYATIELTAICDALIQNGVSEILLNSVHQVEYHRFPSEVRIFHGLPTHDLWSAGLDSSFEAAFVVGMHAMAGGREKGCWRHTALTHPITFGYSSVEAVWLNDRLVGEFGLFAAFAGVHDVPVVLMTGDHWACIEAKDLIPEIETVAVKEGKSYFSALSMTPQAAAEASAKGAVQSLQKIGRVKPLKIEDPVTLKVRYQFVERATDAISAVKGAVRIDERTVAKTFPDVAALRDNFGTLRAPEHELYTRDLETEQTTGFFTRYGPEPYHSRPTFPA